MNTNRGIFENFPNNHAGTAKDSPFAVVPEAPESHGPASPFSPSPRSDSPFTVMEDKQDSRPAESGKPARLPEKRKADSPFQVSEPGESFGFEAPSRPTSPAPAPSPFSAAPQAFSPDSAPAASPSTQAALAAFGGWPEPSATAQPQAPATVPAAAPRPVAPTEAPGVFDESHSDSFSIRQLELRAIFGVDREMNTEEILQRSRALPGIRHIARVGQKDMGTIEGLRNLLPNLGFGSGTLKLYAGSVPLEFIREGSVLLAVQTDGGFAPGVRETLMIVARELGKNS